jgi:hypothetical protein
MNKTRWRIRVWLPDHENPSLTRYRNGSCKLCMAQFADAAAQALTVNLGARNGACTWTVDRLYGHLNGWKVVVHSGMTQGGLLKCHEHRTDTTGTVGASGDRERLERDGGTG